MVCFYFYSKFLEYSSLITSIWYIIFWVLWFFFIILSISLFIACPINIVYMSRWYISSWFWFSYLFFFKCWYHTTSSIRYSFQLLYNPYHYFVFLYLHIIFIIMVVPYLYYHRFPIINQFDMHNKMIQQTQKMIHHHAYQIIMR